ncbi:MogA/MoaB family molybdenum cofactor biosynthesis protein [Corynebacterium frankenforstense]
MTPTPLTAAVIVVSDRVAAGERADKSGPAIRETLDAAGLDVGETVVVAEGADAVGAALDAELVRGTRVIFTTGGTGITAHNLTPEVTADRLAVELPGVATQILLRGLESSPKSGLSRGRVGLTARTPGASLIVNAPGSSGGARDAAEVVTPLIPSIFRQLGE